MGTRFKQTTLPALDPGLKFKSVDRLLSPHEARVYKIIHNSVPVGTILMSKIRCADLLLPDGQSHSENYSLFGRIKAMHFDYVLVDANSFRPLLAIELQDSSHKTSHAKSRDAKKKAACDVANFPLIRITKSQYLTEAKMSQKILSELEKYWSDSQYAA